MATRSTAARRRKPATTKPRRGRSSAAAAASRDAREENAPDFRETIIRAITDLNHEAGHMSWWTPTDLKNSMKNARSTTTMRLATMRAEGIIAYELVFGAGIGGATAGYHYALPGTPPSGGSDIIESDADLERRAIELARSAAARAEGRKPRNGHNRVAKGRLSVSTTADEELWLKAQTDILGQGVPKKFVLDTLIRAYFDHRSHQRTRRDPFERANRYLPRPSGPLLPDAQGGDEQPQDEPQEEQDHLPVAVNG